MRAPAMCGGGDEGVLTSSSLETQTLTRVSHLSSYGIASLLTSTS